MKGELADGFSGEKRREALVHHEGIFGYLARVVVGGHVLTQRGAGALHVLEPVAVGKAIVRSACMNQRKPET